MVGINECKIGADNCAAADSTCTDTLGNFECTCNPGFSEDGTIACLNEFLLSTVNECKVLNFSRFFVMISTVLQISMSVTLELITVLLMPLVWTTLAALSVCVTQVFQEMGQLNVYC